MNIADRDFLWPTLSQEQSKKRRVYFCDGVLMKQIPLISIVSGTRIYPNLCVYLLVVGTFFFFRQVSLDSGQRRSPRCVMGKQVVILQRGKWSLREQKFGWNSFWFWCFGVRVFVCFSTDDKKPWSRNKSYFFTFQEVLLCMIHARLGERLGTEACGTRECWTEIRFLWLM